LRKSDDSIAKQTLLHFKTTEVEGDKVILGKEIWKRNNGRIQVELEENGDGSTRQNCMEKSGLWSVLHWE